MVKHIVKYILTFFGIAFLLTCMLVISAKIPQAAIKENVGESATYLCEGELFGRIVEYVEGSEIDRYSDSILLGIAYQYDSRKPLSSVMESAYYHSDMNNENENLLTAVTQDCEANQQYLRYWHGSNVFVRPLLVIFNIKQIYVLNGILLVALILGLLVTLIRKKAYIPAVGVVTGLIMTSAWFVPLSLEYTWTYLIMLGMSIIGVRLIYHKKYKVVGVFFLISGMLTSYMDFLTTETLTLTVPLLLMLWVKDKQKGQEEMKDSIQFAGKSIIAWAFGYMGMWMMKWLLASVVLSENVMPYVSEHIEERIGGNIGIGPVRYILGSVWNNIRCLFPFEYGMIGALTGIVLVLFVIYIGYVYHGNHIDKKQVLLYVLIGLIPYIRYMVLHNHSYLHCFFTYRAQMATILAVILIVNDLVKEVVAGYKKKR